MFKLGSESEVYSVGGRRYGGSGPHPWPLKSTDFMGFSGPNRCWAPPCKKNLKKKEKSRNDIFDTFIFGLFLHIFSVMVKTNQSVEKQIFRIKRNKYGKIWIYVNKPIHLLALCNMYTIITICWLCKCWQGDLCVGNCAEDSKSINRSSRSFSILYTTVAQFSSRQRLESTVVHC